MKLCNACAQECSNQQGSVFDGNLLTSSKPHSKKILSLGWNGKFNDTHSVYLTIKV